MGVLYKLTSPSGKSYIGISCKSTEDRWSKHVEHAKGKRTAGALYGALRKYGPDSFVRETLAVEADWDKLCLMEIDAIRLHGTRSPGGYNMTRGGEGNVGPRDDAFKKVVSIAQKKRFEDPEQRRLLSQCAKKAREVMAAKRLANPKPPKPQKPRLSKKEVSNRIKSAMVRPEVKAKVIACAKKRAANPEWRKKISESKRGAKMPARTPEWRAMVAEMRRREWADPVFREKRLAILAAAREAKRLRQANKESTGATV